MNKSKLEMAITDPDYKLWIRDIESRFRQQQIKAAVQVNSSKIEFYWSLGRDICEMQVEKRYGDKVIEALSMDLRNVIPDATGLTPGGLYYCKRFYLLYSQIFQKVPQVGEISAREDESRTLQKVPQVVELFKPLHIVPISNDILPLNIFAIPWGHHKVILDRFENDPEKALFYAAKTLENSWSRSLLGLCVA